MRLSRFLILLHIVRPEVWSHPGCRCWRTYPTALPCESNGKVERISQEMTLQIHGVCCRGSAAPPKNACESCTTNKPLCIHSQSISRNRLGHMGWMPTLLVRFVGDSRTELQDLGTSSASASRGSLEGFMFSCSHFCTTVIT